MRKSPLFLGKTGWLLSALFGSRFIFNVSDLWPESAEKIGVDHQQNCLADSHLGGRILSTDGPIWLRAKPKASLKTYKRVFPRKKTYWLPNGVDTTLFIPHKDDTWRKQNGFNADDFLCIYAGIIRYAQGLRIILESARKTEHDSRIKYLLVGSGPEKKSCGN